MGCSSGGACGGECICLPAFEGSFLACWQLHGRLHLVQFHEAPSVLCLGSAGLQHLSALVHATTCPSGKDAAHKNRCCCCGQLFA